MVHFEKQATVPNLPPVDKKIAPRSMPSPEFEMLIEKYVHGVKPEGQSQWTKGICVSSSE